MGFILILSLLKIYSSYCEFYFYKSNLEDRIRSRRYIKENTAEFILVAYLDTTRYTSTHTSILDNTEIKRVEYCLLSYSEHCFEPAIPLHRDLAKLPMQCFGSLSALFTQASGISVSLNVPSVLTHFGICGVIPNSRGKFRCFLTDN